MADDDDRKEEIVSSQEKAGLATLLAFASRNDLILSLITRLQRDAQRLSSLEVNERLDEIYGAVGAHIAQLRSFLRNRGTEKDFIHGLHRAKEGAAGGSDPIALRIRELLAVFTVIGEFAERAQLITTFQYPDVDYEAAIWEELTEEAVVEALAEEREKEGKTLAEVDDL